jgi:APA family basic amino acid/polyamine antiporter
MARRLGVVNAVVIGLGARLGAGVFASCAPGAGAGLMIEPAVATLVAYCNATSSARPAAAAWL